jgi:glycosyltransferase involved in cell wall biosynthesis
MKLKTILFELFQIILVLLFIPFFILIVLFILLLKFKKKNNKVIFAGLEHVINKTIVRGEYFKENNYDVIYYSFEKTELSPKERLINELKKSKVLLISDFFYFIVLLLKNKPKYIEIYFEGLCINQLFYVFISRIYNCYVISIFRGGEFYYNETNSENLTQKIKTKIVVLISKMSNHIFYRETYMLNHIKKYKINTKKCFFDHNCVKVKPLEQLEVSEISNSNPKKIVFLNGIKKWRRIEILIEAVNLIKNENIKLIIVGCRNINEYQYVENLTKKYNISDITEIHYWTKESELYYSDAYLFVLPADLIYCNFSLLEAMERGIPAIVSNVDDSDKIIDHDFDGFIVDQNPNDFSKAIKKLIDDPIKRNNFAFQARQKILSKYDDKNRINKILELINNHYA